ncbi:Rhodanese domain-containing protein [Mycena indigotica]|uniref:Rhodanese domain-containing protein n=1 Tax=Mycena indigotica TaxID=2126181 RepID=A0A8H6SH80_9AGAR|nr:Rhodanese domain-containing protein [Mycena indigotica]KAF7298913.1 Rhodanese domain-containing protein [Mycena indigotica]
MQDYLEHVTNELSSPLMSSNTSTPQWHAAFPTPTLSAESISPSQLADILLDPKSQVLRDYVVVDVRRTVTDFEEFAIPGCLNLPAHSFYQTLPTIVKLLEPVPLVVFHCNSCKEGGRGWRTAGWYRDAVTAGSSSKAVILDGGIKGWIEQFGHDERLCKRI